MQSKFYLAVIPNAYERVAIMKVMAVILNYNSTDDTENCIKWLSKQSYPNLMIVVVDNFSSVGVEELELFCNGRDVHFIKNTENRGYSAGNNVGLKYAEQCHCNYALLINPDMEIRNPEYVHQVIQILEKDSNIAVLGTDIVNIQNQHQNPMYEVPYFKELFWPIELIGNKLKKNKLPYLGDYKNSGYCEKVSGCCLFVRMDFIKQMGYLDETVFLYCEEPILAASVKRYGKKEYYVAGLTAYHMHEESVKGNQKARLNEFLKSRSYYLKQYSGYKGIALKLILWSRSIQNYFYKHR